MNLKASEIQEFRDIQNINRKTIEHLKNFITEGVSEKEIQGEAENFMKQSGISQFWYYGIGAFVFVGERTTLSISGKNYLSTNTKVKNTDLVTVDLSPEKNKKWGDFSRSFYIKNGKVLDTISSCASEIAEGIKIENSLHKKMREIVSEEMTFEELFFQMNFYIGEQGYQNLDFGGNLGHTIVENKNQRIYIEQGNNIKFKDINLFTFEPHIQKKESLKNLGFKKENIYFFENGILQEL